MHPKRFCLAFTAIFLAFFACLEVHAQGRGERCLEVGNAYNWFEFGPNGNNGVTAAQHMATMNFAQIINTAVIGNATKLTIHGRGYSGQIGPDFDYSRFRETVDAIHSIGINTIHIHGPFWWQHFNFLWQAQLIAHLESLNTQQIRTYMRHVLSAMEHNIKRTNFNVAGQSTTMRQDELVVDVLIEPTRDGGWQNAQNIQGLARGNQAGDVNTFLTSQSSYTSSFWARAGQDYVNYALRTAREVFGPRVKLAVDEYGAIGNWERGGIIQGKPEAFSRIVEANIDYIDIVKLQWDVELPQNQNEINALYQKFRATAARYAEMGIEVAVSSASVRMAAHQANDPAALQLQADTFVAMTRACVDSPNCFRFFFFGIIDPFWWGQSVFGTMHALLFSNVFNSNIPSLQPKPAYYALRNYLNGLTTKRPCARWR